MQSDLHPDIREKGSNLVNKIKQWGKTVGLSVGVGLILSMPGSKAESLQKYNPEQALQQGIKIDQVDSTTQKSGEIQANQEMPLDQALEQVEKQLINLSKVVDLNYEGKTLEEKAEQTLQNISKILSLLATITLGVKLLTMIDYINSIKEKSDRTATEMLGNLSDSFLWISQDIAGLATAPNKSEVIYNIVNHVIDIIISSGSLAKITLMNKGINSDELKIENFQSVIKIIKKELENKKTESTNSADKIEELITLFDTLSTTGFEDIKKYSAETLHKLIEKISEMEGHQKVELIILSVYYISMLFGGQAAQYVGIFKDAFYNYRLMAAKDDRPNVVTQIDEFTNFGFWATQENFMYKLLGVSQYLAILTAYGVRGARRVNDWGKQSKLIDSMNTDLRDIKIVREMTSLMQKMCDEYTTQVNLRNLSDGTYTNIPSYLRPPYF